MREKRSLCGTFFSFPKWQNKHARVRYIFFILHNFLYQFVHIILQTDFIARFKYLGIFNAKDLNFIVHTIDIFLWSSTQSYITLIVGNIKLAFTFKWSCSNGFFEVSSSIVMVSRIPSLNIFYFSYKIK